MQMTKIYVLSEPSGPVRYVGKTVQPLAHRLSSHRSTARHGQDHRSRWIRKCASIDIDLVAEVVGDGAAEEIALIAGLRAIGARLVNQTEGGEGTTGRVWTAEQRSAIAARLRGRRGKKHSPETRARISAANKGRTPSRAAIEAGAKTRTGVKRGPLSKSTKMRVSAAKRAKLAAAFRGAMDLVMLGETHQHAADAFGVSQSQLSSRIKNPDPSRCR